MKRIFTVVPPSVTSAGELGRSASVVNASVGAQPQRVKAGGPPGESAVAPASSPDSSTWPNFAPEAERSRAAQRSVGSAFDGLRTSLDIGSLPSWLGGSFGPGATKGASEKGKERLVDGSEPMSVGRASFDDAPDPLLRSLSPTATVSSTDPTPSGPQPPSLISSFPVLVRPTPREALNADGRPLADQLLEALDEPIGTSEIASHQRATTPPAQPFRTHSSPDVPLALPSLYASASTGATFVPPVSIAPPPMAHLESPRSTTVPSSVIQGQPARKASHVRQASFTHRKATANATSSFFNPPSSRSHSPTGFGGPYLQRSATLSSIDSLRHVQRQHSGQGQQVRPISSGSGWWREHKAMVDGMLKDEDKGDTIEDEEEAIARRHLAPQHPVVFCHGLFGFDHLGPASLPALQISHWRGIKEVLEGNKTEVFIARVPATSSIEERARTLKAHIEEHFPGRTVNLVGHSMGGLDCRYLISKLKPYNFKVASLTTIATPHRGSAFADHLIDDIIGRASGKLYPATSSRISLTPLRRSETNMPSVLSMLDVIRLPNQGDGQAFDALSTRAMKVFNLDVQDDPDVKYYSWGAKFEPSYFNTFK